MLQAYCRHRAIADEMSELIEAFDPAWLAEAKGQRRYEWLAKMGRVESKAALETARSLRLTNLSRWTKPRDAERAISRDEESGGSSEDDMSIWQAERRA